MEPLQCQSHCLSMPKFLKWCHIWAEPPSSIHTVMHETWQWCISATQPVYGSCMHPEVRGHICFGGYQPVTWPLKVSVCCCRNFPQTRQKQIAKNRIHWSVQMEFGYSFGKKMGKLGVPKHTYTKQVHESGTCAQTKYLRPLPCARCNQYQPLGDRTLVSLSYARTRAAAKTKSSASCAFCCWSRTVCESLLSTGVQEFVSWLCYVVPRFNQELFRCTFSNLANVQDETKIFSFYHHQAVVYGPTSNPPLSKSWNPLCVCKCTYLSGCCK